MIARVKPDKRIPENLREIYAHLAGNLIWTYGAFEELMFLFGTSETVNLLNEALPAFFVRHEDLLLENIILSLARMTDEKWSGSRKNRQENLTLANILDLPDAQYQQLRAELRKKWTKIRDAAKQLRTYRHKRLAHSDLAHHLSPSTKVAPDISVRSIKKLLEQISDLLKTFDHFFTGVEPGYEPPATYGDASDLIAYLQVAIEAKKKAKDDVLKAEDEASRR